jgi:hypothetical protein
LKINNPSNHLILKVNQKHSELQEGVQAQQLTILLPVFPGEYHYAKLFLPNSRQRHLTLKINNKVVLMKMP